MSKYDRFKQGISIADQSFSFILKNKRLLLYLVIPLLIAVFSPNKMLFAPLLLISIFIYFLAEVALTKHTQDVIEKKESSIKDNIAFGFSKYKTAIAWSLIAIIPVLIKLLHMTAKKVPDLSTTTMEGQKPLNHFLELSILDNYKTLVSTDFFIFAMAFLFVLFIANLLFYLFTAFLPQVVTFEGVGILKGLKKAINTIKHIFFQYIGIIFWITVVLLVIGLPFSIITYVLKTFVTKYNIDKIIEFILYIFVSTSFVIAKAILYKQFKNRKHEA